MRGTQLTLGARESFVAIDFETADDGADSACAVGLVRVEGGRIVARASARIRPPRRRFLYTHVHGLRWQDVAHEPDFAGVWPTLAPLLAGVDVLVAHNAAFDRGVLRACCAAAGLPMPPQPFRCTVRLARKAWNLRPTRLPDVCAHLGLPLRHHDAASDAEACARIMIALQTAGAALPAGASLARDAAVVSPARTRRPPGGGRGRRGSRTARRP